MRSAATLFCAFLAASCAPAPVAPVAVTAPAGPAPPSRHAGLRREAPDAPFRATSPALASSEPLPAPPIRTLRTSNGIRVLFLEQHSRGLLGVAIVATSGAGVLGANEMAVAALAHGTATHSGAQFRAGWDAQLARQAGWSGQGILNVSVTVVADHAGSALDMLGEMVSAPAFPQADLTRTLANATHERQTRDDAPRWLAERVMPMALFGWTRPDDADMYLRSEDFAAITRDDVLKAYEQAFDPARVTIVVAGDTTEDALRPMLDHAFGAWKGHGAHAPAHVPPPVLATNTPRLVVLDRPDSAQAFVLFGGPGPAPGSGDWGPARVVVTMMNGSSGHVARGLRGANVTVQGAWMRIYVSRDAPRMYLSTEVPLAQAGAALREMDGSLRGMATRGPSEAELEETRAHLLRTDAGWLMTLAQEMDTLGGLPAYDLPPDTLAKQAAALRDMGMADVRRAAESFFDAGKMKVVVVGDWSKLRSQLGELGWGPIELRDRSGAVVRVEPAPAPR